MKGRRILLVALVAVAIKAVTVDDIEAFTDNTAYKQVICDPKLKGTQTECSDVIYEDITQIILDLFE